MTKIQHQGKFKFQHPIQGHVDHDGPGQKRDAGTNQASVHEMEFAESGMNLKVPATNFLLDR